jgi:hypothetical protein
MKTIQNSLLEGTFTKSGDGLKLVYGINRATRRKMAKVLKTPWLHFNLMLLKEPQIVISAYRDTMGLPPLSNFGGVTYEAIT